MKAIEKAGKRERVIDPHETARAQALGYGASALEGGFGFIQFFLHHNRQCVHDRIAETIVVKEQRRAQLPSRS